LTIYFDGIGEARGTWYCDNCVQWSTAVKERDHQGEEERIPAAFDKVREAPAATWRRPGGVRVFTHVGAFLFPGN
jgi:hypothetical protein